MSTKAMATKVAEPGKTIRYKMVMEVQYKMVLEAATSKDHEKEEGWEMVDIDAANAPEDTKGNDDQPRVTTIPVPDSLADKEQAAQLTGCLVQLLSQSMQDLTEALHVETSRETKSNLYSRIDELRWKLSTAREMGALIKELAKK